MKNIFKIFKKIARNFGVELRRFTLSTSETARMQHLFTNKDLDCVLDVGANIGQYAKTIRELGYTGKIVSFEPLSSAYSSLKSASSSDPLWHIAPRAAIGDKDGEIEIQIAGNSQGSSILNILDAHIEVTPDFAYIDSELVQLRRLDSIANDYFNSFEEANSIYLKIDVQGFELQVLEGASQLLPKITIVQLEMTLTSLYENQPLWNQILERMEQLGYELYTVLPLFFDMNTGRLLQMDGIFTKK